MNSSDVLKQIFAGLFFIAGLMLVGWVIFVIGFQRGLTQPKFELQVLFKEVSGLSEGAPVRLSGVNVGSVGTIDFLPEEIMGHGLVATLDLYQKYRPQLKKATSISIRTEGVLGEAYIDISADPQLKPIDLNQQVVGVGPLDIYDMAQVLNNTATSFQDTAQGISVLIDEASYVTGKMKRLLNRIEQRVIDGNLFKVF